MMMKKGDVEEVMYDKDIIKKDLIWEKFRKVQHELIFPHYIHLIIIHYY